MMLMISRLGGENGGELVHTVVHNNHNQPEVRLLFDPGHNHNHNNNQPFLSWSDRIASLVTRLQRDQEF